MVAGVDQCLWRRIEADLRGAIRANDRARVSVLRTILAVLGNAEAVPADRHGPGRGVGSTEVERRALPTEAVRRLVVDERDDLLLDAAAMRVLGRADQAEVLVAQAAVLDGYLAA